MLEVRLDRGQLASPAGGEDAHLHVRCAASRERGELAGGALGIIGAAERAGKGELAQWIGTATRGARIAAAFAARSGSR
jgi:hypothetical protein